MKLKILGSSSSGNCYLLIGEKETLIIDAGISFKKAKEALNFDISSVVGLCLDHSHGDHSKHVKSFMNAGIDIYSSKECFEEIGISHHRAHEIKEQVLYKIGSFKILPFPLSHDVKNFGFLINHPESGLIVFLTDTHFCKYKFKNLNQVIVEANYSIDIVDNNLLEGRGHHSIRDRILTSHMEINTTKAFLAANDLSRVSNIVLIHLSDGNSDAKLFKSEVEQLTGKNVHIAEAGLEIDFNINPF